MDKLVFCSHCKFYKRGYFIIDRCLAKKYYHNSYRVQSIFYASCMQKNRLNDCQDFELKQKNKLLKIFLREIK